MLKITYFKRNSDSESNIKAFVGFRIESLDLYLSKCTVVQTKSGASFISFPSERVENKETGQKEYKNYFWFGKKFRDSFQEKAMELVKEEFKKAPEPAKQEFSATVTDSKLFDDLPF
jgi:DNA-binding cell septation regulator SpoVG